VGGEEEIVQQLTDNGDRGVGIPDVINDQHQLNPDIRLVRNIWTRKGILRRGVRI
jgi:hypothetical protein